MPPLQPRPLASTCLTESVPIRAAGRGVLRPCVFDCNWPLCQQLLILRFVYPCPAGQQHADVRPPILYLILFWRASPPGSLFP